MSANKRGTVCCLVLGYDYHETKSVVTYSWRGSDIGNVSNLGTELIVRHIWKLPMKS